ncbi:hypothetical protein NA57DRAFT_31494 [Rhizodiscina lignyota]|uniref:Cyclin N-terminal domain-containing protein n=1 Tax=Rhizodiscina lignyota TaxID=1504668 RepID=A0A9P4INA5_9PEZI|nr:hypothetical protein NA57DRAFT_31494 [Rhizodiscina lignyota]
MAFPQQYPRYGQCDSFFVESEDGLAAIRAEERERSRVVSRMRQRSMAEELSRATAEEYQEDVLDHMERMETEIQWFMRPYLLDFLIEAHTAFQLLPDTLFLAVNLLDRYCSRRVVYKRHYQLVGCAALLVASKYGDKKDHVPQIKELKSMCCGLYEEDMFIQMERHVLSTLQYYIGHPTVDSFLQIALSEASYDPEVEHMAWYISEIALFHRDFVSMRPSVIARSALALARCILARSQSRPQDWAGSYDIGTVHLLSNYLFQPSAVLQRKYASMHLSGVSHTVEGFLARQAQLARQRNSVSMMEEEHTVEHVAPKPSGMPQTPQKQQVNSVMQYGALTPPITPDHEKFGESGYGTNNGMFPRLPHTPSPLSASHQPPQGQPPITYTSFPPPSYVHQPHC